MIPNQPPIRLREEPELQAQSSEYLGILPRDLIERRDYYSPFHDSLTIQEVQETIAYMRQRGTIGQQFNKRFENFEHNLNGALQRNLLIVREGSENKDYYEVLKNMDVKLMKEEVKLNNLQARTKARISALQQEVTELREVVKRYQDNDERKDILAQMFEQINSMTRQNTRQRDFTTFLQTRVIPEIQQYRKRIENVQESVRQLPARNSRIKGTIQNYLRDIQRLLREDNRDGLSLEQAIENSTYNFLVAAFYTKSQQQVENWRHLSEELTKSQGFIRSAFSVIETKLKAIQQGEQAKQAQRLNDLIQTFKQLSEDTTQRLFEFKGWVQSESTGKVVYIQQQDAETKDLIITLASQMKKIIKKYPKLELQIPSTLLQYLDSDVIRDSASSDALNRLQALIKKEQSIIQVDNVYRYSTTEEREKVFHLRILIKALLEELMRAVKQTHWLINMDEGILGMIKESAIEGLDVSYIYQLFRPQAKIVQVDRIMERIVPVIHQFTIQKAVYCAQTITLEAQVQKPISIVKEVPVQFQTTNVVTIKEQVAVPVKSEVPIKMCDIHQICVEKVAEQIRYEQISQQTIVETSHEKLIKKEVKIEKGFDKQIPKQMPVPYEVKSRPEIQVVEHFIQKLVPVQRTIEVPREIVIQRSVPYYKDKCVEVPTKVPVVAYSDRTVQIVQEKIVPVRTFHQKPVQVPCRHEVMAIEERKTTEVKIQTVQVPYISQIQKECLVDVYDYFQVTEVRVKEVQIVKQVPIQSQKLVIQKTIHCIKEVPVQLHQQVPIEIEGHPQVIQIPVVQYLNTTYHEPVEVIRETLREVPTQVPYPILIHKEILKVVPQAYPKIIYKTVEVPMVVQVQKIVEKIVVVPRIVHVPYEVPVIYEKIVVIEKPVLHVVEVTGRTQYITTLNEKILPVERTKIQQVPIYQPKEVRVDWCEYLCAEKPVYQNLTQHHYIPQEVRIQFPKEIIREVLVEVPKYIYEDRPIIKEIGIPFKKYQVAIQQKPIIVEEFSVKPYPVELVVEKVVPMYITRQEIFEVQCWSAVPIKFESVIEVEKEIIVKEAVEIPKELRVIQCQYLTQREQILKEEHCTTIKQVPIFCEKPVFLNKPYFFKQPYYCELRKEDAVEIRKDVALNVPTIRDMPIQSRWQNIKEIQIHHIEEKPYQVESFKVQRMVKEVVVHQKEKPQVKIIKEQVQMIIYKPQIVEVPGKTQQIAKYQTIQKIRIEPEYHEKVVQTIRLMPQVHQVVKTVHQITEVESLGVQSHLSQENHKIHATQLVGQVRQNLSKLLAELRQARTMQRPNDLIALIQKYFKHIDAWMKFPKILKIQTQVQVIKEKDRPVIVPVEDRKRETVLTDIIHQLLIELKKKYQNGAISTLPGHINWVMQLNLQGNNLSIDPEFDTYFKNVQKKFQSQGIWKTNHLSMLYSLLANRFAYANILNSDNLTIKRLRQQIGRLKVQGRQLIHDYLSLVEVLKRHRCNEYKQIEDALSRFGGRFGGNQDPFSGEEPEDPNQDHYERGGHGHDDRPDRPPGGSRSQFSSYRGTHHSGLHELRMSVSRERGIYGTQLVQSQIYLPASEQTQSQIQQLIKLYSKIEYEKNELQKQVQQLRQTRLNAQGGQEGQVPDIQQVRNIYESKIQTLQNDYKVIKGDYDKLQMQRSVSGRELQGNAERIRKQITDEYQRKIKSTQNQHKREIQRLNQELNNAMRAQTTSPSTGNLDRVKKQLNDDFDRRLKAIEEAHQKQLETLRIQHQSSSRGQQSRLVHENKELGKKINQMAEEIESLKKSVTQQRYEPNQGYQIGHTESRTSRRSEEFGRRQTQTRQTGSRKFIKSKIQQSPQTFGYEEQGSAKSSKDANLGNRTWKTKMTLRQFMENQPTEQLITNVMLKVIDAMQQENERGIFNCYTPNNINIQDFNIANLEQMSIKFGKHIINKNNRKDGCYIAPEVAEGGKIDSKAIVFTLGVIWDQLFHRSPFFTTIAEVRNPQVHYEVRNPNISPIAKNLLVDMLVRDPSQRQDLKEARRRIDLQRYVTGTMTTSPVRPAYQRRT